MDSRVQQEEVGLGETEGPRARLAWGLVGVSHHCGGLGGGLILRHSLLLQQGQPWEPRIGAGGGDGA